MSDLFSNCIICAFAAATPQQTVWTVARIQTWLTTIAVVITVCLVIWQTFSERTNRKRKNAETLDKAQSEADRIIAEARSRAEEIRSQAALAAEQQKEHAKQDAEVLVIQAQLQAKEAIVAAKDEFERNQEERRREQERISQRLAQKEDALEQKSCQLQTSFDRLNEREEALKNRIGTVEERENRLANAENEQREALMKIAGMTAGEARNTLLESLEHSLLGERARLIRRYQDENRQMMGDEGRRIMIDAMQRYAGDCTYERTTATIPLPNDEMKGRIIGRDGRNIRTIEAATGAGVLIDDTPQAVVISCFDPVRREIARLSLERLVSDGRIHPAHVEEIVEKTRKDIEAEIEKAGSQTAEKLGIVNLRPTLITLLGRLKFRYSFSQNVLSHSVEVASMMGAIAADLGLDEQQARRAGLLHDIGKAVDHEVEGSHAVIGAELLRRAGECEEVVNAVAAHHGDTEKTSLIAELVQICDTVSAGRPGARNETTEFYLKRLEDLEKIGNSFDGVDSCFAIQAGRELRIIVRPEEISEEQATIMARDIAARIEREMRYPGQIRVSIIRETRAVEYAR